MKELPRNMTGLAAMATGLVLAFGVNAAEFGAPMPAGKAMASVAIDAAVADAEKYAGKQHLFAGRITEVCQAEGCWLMIEKNGVAARVMTRDHAFTVPKDAKGTAVVYGVLSVKALSPAAAAHMAEDAGHAGHEEHAAPTAATQEYRIDATSISIKP